MQVQLMACQKIYTPKERYLADLKIQALLTSSNSLALIFCTACCTITLSRSRRSLRNHSTMRLLAVAALLATAPRAAPLAAVAIQFNFTAVRGEKTSHTGAVYGLRICPETPFELS